MRRDPDVCISILVVVNVFAAVYVFEDHFRVSSDKEEVMNRRAQVVGHVEEPVEPSEREFLPLPPKMSKAVLPARPQDSHSSPKHSKHVDVVAKRLEVHDLIRLEEQRPTTPMPPPALSPPGHVLHASWEAWVSAGQPQGFSTGAAVAVGAQVHHLPYFSVIGAQKAGTTYLRWLLVQHPNLESGDGLHGETRGEPHFFDWGYPDGASTAEVARKYSKMFHRPRALFNGSVAYFDTTPAYVVELEVPGRVHALLPGMRLIVIIRDPTDRYRSELQMEICRARLGDISDQYHRHGAMGDYLTSPVAPNHKPLKRGLYAPQLAAWLELFPRDHLLVLTSDELYKESAKAAAAVLGFLQLPTPPGFVFNFKAPKNAACARDMAPFVDDSELAAMRAYYREHNGGLPALTGMSFPWLE